ncbi:tRNA wybutosine-synthesizing protein 5 isoform X1 [Selaginella moellendorffii]|uniref:tRNA wybutosine-synthesizing protein 5 isoform X1 n=2 Tax=Selaginella moellendorffii TaxID=88036 RepID=UPI000D1D057B|nr:tRNA wybutosine-synthesizing protein 5 isoform X1 [Selaginella moellendorffii]|eukprot:XP_024520670.1 tRNA wybutosine-synthesizing protein 5 isoform X1 [Selaginella moellendorffii]
MAENWRPPSRDEFREMEARNIPVVFPGILRQWPAFERWNPATGGVEHLKEIAGEPLVQAMVSTDGSTFFGDIRSHERVALPFREYLDMVLSPGEHNDHFYLAQVPICVKDSTEKPPLASLESEISLPEFLDEDAVSNINLWMSSTSSRSSIHYDPYHNVLGVVTGQKKVTLWPPDAAPYLYPKPLYGEASNHSEVNFVEPDYQKYPRFRDASKHSRVLVVDAGSAVFIPEGWFHQVDSAALTIAVNFWWASKQSCAFDTPMDAYYLRRILVSLLDAEKVNKQQLPMQFTYIVLQRSMLGWNPHVDVEIDLDDVQGAEDLTVNSLSPLETKQLHVILSCVAVAVNNGNCEDDPIASVFLNTSPRSLRRIFLTMVTTFPRSLEALVLHALSPVAAELLTKQFEEMDSIASEASQAEFYKRFYSVFDDSSVAMAALLDRKEAFASKALDSVMEKFLGCKLH